jgi:hypothetical protein
MKRLTVYGLALIALALMACATTTSGPTLPAGSALSQILGKNVLMNDPGVLDLYATTTCNTLAADELRLSIEVCSGQLAAVAGGAIIPANVVAGINFACATLGYTNAQNQLLPTVLAYQPIQPGPATACLNPPAAMSASKLPPLRSAI